MIGQLSYIASTIKHCLSNTQGSMLQLSSHLCQYVGLLTSLLSGSHAKLRTKNWTLRLVYVLPQSEREWYLSSLWHPVRYTDTSTDQLRVMTKITRRGLDSNSGPLRERQTRYNWATHSTVALWFQSLELSLYIHVYQRTKSLYTCTSKTVWNSTKP